MRTDPWASFLDMLSRADNPPPPDAECQRLGQHLYKVHGKLTPTDLACARCGQRWYPLPR